MTRWIGICCGETFPFYYVSEHPKSGGSWLAKMVADYFQLPFPQFYSLPLSFSCVILNHWEYHPRMQRVFYLYRDGRDVMVSYYFHLTHMAEHFKNPSQARVVRTYEGLFGKGYDRADVMTHLPRFIEHEFSNPGRGTRLNWREHTESWLLPIHPGTVALSYENLRTDCYSALKRAIETMTGEAVDTWRLETAIEKMSMKRQTGRDPGTADVTQHSRKGIVGDWRNYFSREAAEVFNEFAGDALVRLGYEQDGNWVDRYDYP